MQARTSASSQPGYSSRMAWTVQPLARKSRMRETQMRCPRIHGLPKQMLGLMEIRDSNSVLVMANFLYGYQQGISTYLMGIVPISCTSVRPGHSQDIPLIQPDVAHAKAGKSCQSRRENSGSGDPYEGFHIPGNLLCTCSVAT